jgi:tryptophanyl-tRNA synthetase
MNKEVILTGLRANNDLHIGNYLGALLAIIDMAKEHSDEYQVNLMVADLHSFTTPIDHARLYDQISQNLKVYVAAGLPLDKENIRIFRQSYIPAHSELAWIFDCFTGMGELSRMTEFKDKSAKLGEERINVGLFNYPALMAADVLLYNAKFVPVGADQTQHLEYMRDIAERMNNKFGELFVVPEAVAKQHEFFGKDQGLRIRDLVNPNKKMSKSDESGRGVIFLSDNPVDAAQKVMSATTDSEGSIHWDWEKQPGITNLLQILDLLSDYRNRDIGGLPPDIKTEWEGRASYGELKSEVAEAVKIFLVDIQEKLTSVNQDQLMQKLEADEAAMSIVANVTLERVQQAVGLRAKPQS